MYRLIAAAVLVFVIAVVWLYTRLHTDHGPGRQCHLKLRTARPRQTGARSSYGQYCSTCHLETLKGKCAAEDLSSTSYVCGATGSAPPLVGASFMKRFYSVGDLYSRVKWTMPAPGRTVWARRTT